MLEEIIAGLIGITLITVMIIYRKPIKKYKNQVDKFLDNLEDEFQRYIDIKKKESNERIVGEMRKFVENVDEKNMKMSQMWTKQILLYIDFIGEYPNNLQETWFEIKQKERKENIVSRMKKFVENVDEKNMTQAQIETKKLVSEIERTGIYPDDFPTRFYNIMRNNFKYIGTKQTIL